MRWLVATVLLVRSAAADPAIDYQRATLHALTAKRLAHDGHCDAALALRPQIEQLDAEVARVTYAEDPALVACARGPGVGPPSLAPLVASEPPPPQAPCSSRAYLEPSLLALYDSGQPTLFTRVAAGALIRGCTSPVQVRVGLTTYVGHIGQIGVGVETEANAVVADGVRLGVHLAYETANDGALESADLRLHIRDGAWIQVGAYGWSRFDTVDAGVGGGLGFEGTPGAIVGGAELGLGALLFFAALYAVSHEGT